MELERLKEFLIYTKLNSYANETVKYRKTKLNTKRIELKKDDFLFTDEYVGENPFSGVETVFYKNNPIWQMHYYGWVVDGEDQEKVYGFLNAALRNIDKENPIRGKPNFSSDEFKYTFDLEGNLERFEGREFIFKNEKNIYECVVFGGIISFILEVKN